MYMLCYLLVLDGLRVGVHEGDVSHQSFQGRVLALDHLTTKMATAMVVMISCRDTEAEQQDKTRQKRFEKKEKKKHILHARDRHTHAQAKCTRTHPPPPKKNVCTFFLMVLRSMMFLTLTWYSG